MSERRTRREREEEERRLELERRRRIARARKRRQQVRRRKLMLAGTGLVLLIAGVTAVGFAIHGKIEAKKEKEAQQQQKEAEAKKKAEEEQNTLHMVAAGDNLIHDAIIDAGKENDWNFDFLYKNVKDIIKDADLASVNQETPFVKSHEEAAGYPDFATPTEVGDALVKAGFDIVTQATEHAFDQQEDGIAASVSFWTKNYPKVSLLGIHSKEEERYQILEKKNFKVAVMNYSCMLSENHSIPEDEEYMVDTYSEKRVAADLESAKKEADVTIVYLHGGKSDTPEPDEKLQTRIDFLAEEGADIVIASHPHILKGYELRERPDGEDMLVYYSLGNFVSNQSSLENLLGGLADFTLKKDAKTGEVTIEDYGLIPVVMHYNSDYTEVGVYQLEDYTEVLAKDHGIHEVNEEATFSRAALESAAAKIGELTVGSSLSDEDGDSGDSDSKDSSRNTDGDSDSEDGSRSADGDSDDEDSSQSAGDDSDGENRSRNTDGSSDSDGEQDYE